MVLMPGWRSIRLIAVSLLFATSVAIGTAVTNSRFSRRWQCVCSVTSSVIFLHGLHGVTALLERSDSECGGFGSAQRRHDRCAAVNCRRANLHFIRARCGAAG